ncbi:MAG: transglycosylase domain-containing protein [Vicinamibacteria bacterium]|nr:transglycosylase domain-containing protein [Vicinamibacteria bacterium]
MNAREPEAAQRRPPPWHARMKAVTTVSSRALGALWRYKRRLLLAACGTLVLTVLWYARLDAPRPTCLLRDRQGRFLGEVGAAPGGEYGYWPIERLPERVVAATIAIEDQRFATHPGLDPLAVARALAGNARSGRRVSGASTLAMQIARLSHPGRRTYLRKAFEALEALCITALYGRERILAHYLRIVPYSNGIHGIAYAARRYLDKPVEDLSWAEIAFLAAIPQSPTRMNPFTPNGRQLAVARGKQILALLLARRAMSSAEYELALAQLASLRVPPPGERPAAAMHAILHLDRQIAAEVTNGASAARGVFIVQTTLDLGIQEEVGWIVYRALNEWRGQGAQNAAAIVLDRQTNAVLAWIGSADYFDAAHAGAIDYTQVSRSPGSALKPFIYALAYERGAIAPNTILDDIERGAGGIGNADDLFLGPLLPRVALANSRNVPAANLIARIGLGESYQFLRDLGLHEGRAPARRYGMGLAIGGLPVTLEALVRAYSVLASDGRARDLVWYAPPADRPARRLLSEDSARQVSMQLADPMARLPSFSRMGAMEYPFPAAVKTGTSSRFRDAWTVAYTSRYLIGVWVGDPDFQPMHRLTGYRSAAEIAKRVLVYLHKDQLQGLDDLPFIGRPGHGGLRARTDRVLQARRCAAR